MVLAWCSSSIGCCRWWMVMVKVWDVDVDDRKLFWFPCLGSGGNNGTEGKVSLYWRSDLYSNGSSRGLMCRGGWLWWQAVAAIWPAIKWG
ncbi:hypothetical protein SLA2020_134820 [Shorea laevis]